MPLFRPLDPDAEKPDDWDEDEDGEWEPPTIRNPEYKGPWKPKMIDNPDYKGPWEHPMIPNPAFVEDATLYRRCNDCTHVGIEIWQVDAGTLFDDIIVTDSLEEAQAFAEETWAAKKDKEVEMEKAVKEAEREAEAAARAAEMDDDEEDEEDDEEHDEL